MSFEKRSIYGEFDTKKVEMIKLYNARLDEAAALKKELVANKLDEATAAAVRESLRNIEDEARKIDKILEDWDKPPADGRGVTYNGDLRSIVDGRSVGSFRYGMGGGSSVNNNGREHAEVRSLQKYISSGVSCMTSEERSGLNLSGAAAVLPISIYNELITSNKYSDLLRRAKVFNEQRAGKLYIPIASDTAATWHTELDPATDTAPTLTKIELGGFELMRLMSISAAADSMTEAGFRSTLLQLLGTEVVETLENAFINGNGSGKPIGLVNLTWTTSGTGKNSVEAAAEYGINYKYIAEALSLLPQKYSRNAILLVNSDTAYNTLGTDTDAQARPIFNVGDAVKDVFGHEIVISEYVPDKTAFVVDPRELYVRFSMPLQIEADRSSGFTSATTNLRALCVVDAAWNPAAAVRITTAAS